MILTFTDNIYTIDFKVEENQIIYEVLKVIAENTELNIDIQNQKYITSTRLEEKIHYMQSFKGANILHGDILQIGR